jgi:hypothetical protein
MLAQRQAEAGKGKVDGLQAAIELSEKTYESANVEIKKIEALALEKTEEVEQPKSTGRKKHPGPTIKQQRLAEELRKNAQEKQKSRHEVEPSSTVIEEDKKEENGQKAEQKKSTPKVRKTPRRRKRRSVEEVFGEGSEINQDSQQESFGVGNEVSSE